MNSANEIWEAALGELQLQVNKPNYQTWFKGTQGLAYDGDQFLVGVPNAFVAEKPAFPNRKNAHRAYPPGSECPVQSKLGPGCEMREQG
jgi:hypothetical protein